MDGGQSMKTPRSLTVGCWVCGLWLLGSMAACKPQPAEKKGEETRPATGTVPSGTTSGKGSNTPPPVLADWKDPQGVLVFTGDVHGYLEPCGCAEKQSGGFARRGGLIKLLKEEKKWPVAALDVGGSLNEARITYPQTRIKFDVMLKGLNELGYQGLALGKEELLLGAQDLYTEFTHVSAEEGFHVPFLSANTTIFGSKDLGTPLSTRIIELGGLKIGVTAIAGNATRKELESAGVTRDPGELLVEDPRTVLPAAIQELKAENPDLLVLLSAATMEESTAIAREFPDFQIVVTSGSVEDPRSDAIYIGQTLLVQVGKKGKNAAVVGISPEHQFQYAVLELDQERFEELPAMHQLMGDYQELLKAAWPELSAQKISDPDGRQFLGAASCKACHT